MRAPLKSEVEPIDGTEGLTCDLFILAAFILVRCTWAQRVKEGRQVKVFA